MNKICTTIEQSEKLIESGIDVNTADMYWWSSSKRSYIEAMDDGDFNEAEGHIPAWSLTALLELISNVNLYKSGSKIKIENTYRTIRNDISLIDAAFEMVCWLKENGKI